MSLSFTVTEGYSITITYIANIPILCLKVLQCDSISRIDCQFSSLVYNSIKGQLVYLLNWMTIGSWMDTLSLSTIQTINHLAYQPSSLLTIKPIDHQAYQPSSLLTIKPINLWSSFKTFKIFDLFFLHSFDNL